MHNVRTLRRGFSLVEMLLVLGVAGIMAALALPKLSASGEAASRRAARQSLTAAFAATRAAALQKGKTATLTLTSTTATVTVLSGLAATAVQVLGPEHFDRRYGASIEALYGAPLTVTYNARGLLTPTPTITQMYRIRVGALLDTVCLSASGMLLPKGCRL